MPGTGWTWGYGPRYGYWDGLGWGYGPWGQFGYGRGFNDGYYGGNFGGPYAYGQSYYRQPGYAAAPAPRTGLGIYMDERDNAVFVQSVVRNSPAEEAGLQPGDMIIAINGNLITSADQVRQIVAEHDPGDELEIETDRNGREVRTAAVLEEHRRVF
ncbi:MAG TPA: PDZ domain-containing protein [Pirellulaceae bacterium]|nr:PDZ domain-containing protein [Pirellulaceae bacterium]